MSKNCNVDPVKKTPTAEELATLNFVVLSVWGMGCPTCATRVRNGLLSSLGLIEADVDHRLGMATVVFNPDLATVAGLIGAVARAGADGRRQYGAQLLIPPRTV